MPHRDSSCRNKVPTLIRSELATLYARRTALTDMIQALERDRSNHPVDLPIRPQANLSLEINPKPCNLTSCRNA
jgi:hypothetical protein